MTLIPELGPALGRLAAPPAAVPPGRVPLDDLRLNLVTQVFEHAAAGRRFGDDPVAAAAALSRAAWLGPWEQTVAAAAARLADYVDRQLRAAAAEARLPPKQRARLTLSESDRREIAGRLGAGSLPLFRSVEALERANPSVIGSGTRQDPVVEEWREALLAVARRLEAAWISLEEAAAREPAFWLPAVEEVRAWRRPAWPLWTVTAIGLLVATYLGLVLGGYLPAAGPAGALARAWWYR